MENTVTLENLKTLIEEGVKYSNDKNNKSYLFSSFKRTVSGWNSDFKKADKEKNSEKKQILETKLIEKMKKEADKYLNETKDFFKDSTSITRKPEFVKAKDEYNKQIKQIQKDFYSVYNQIKDDIVPLCNDAYKYYKELKSDYPEKVIEDTVDSIYDSIKNDQSPSKDDAIKAISPDGKNNDFAKEFTKNDKFLEFVFCYAKIKNKVKSFKTSFVKWLAEEYKYLSKFESLSMKDIKKYYKHGAFIDYYKETQVPDDISERLKKLYNRVPVEEYNFLDSLGASFTAAAGAAYFIYPSMVLILLGESIMLVLLTFGIAGGTCIAISAAALALAYEQYKFYTKPLTKSLEGLIKINEEQINRLIISGKSKEKKDLNANKVNYMRKIRDQLNEAKAEATPQPEVTPQTPKEEPKQEQKNTAPTPLPPRTTPTQKASSLKQKIQATTSSSSKRPRLYSELFKKVNERRENNPNLS